VVTAEEEIEVPESNWGRRAGAFVIDMLMVFILCYALFLIFIPNYLLFLPYPVDNLMWFVIFWLIVGIISLLYFGALEGGIGATVGKGIMGLEVYSLNVDPTMTMGQGFSRSLSKFIFFAVAFDIFAGSGKGDPRQRYLDISANTLVGDFIPVERYIPEPRSSDIYVKPIEPKEEEDYFADLPIPKELLSGNCGRCGTPYNIVPSKDRKTWSGLWNSRCIWCNKMVFEEYKRRVEPGKWV
jgi:uncharacterized RDD family membrane protein YckC